MPATLFLMVISTSTSFISAFLASFVEAVEALTIVLAAGSTRGWRPALIAAGTALLVLAALTAAFGPLLLFVPVQIIRLALGSFLLIFGLRWLRKAVLRAAGIIPQRDEAKAYTLTEERLKSGSPKLGHFDWECFATSFYAVFVEGLEVVFIVLSLGAAGNALFAASSGAATACLSVIGLGWVLHRPLIKVPENWFKFFVGVLLTSFGLFWIAEGLKIPWPGGDLALLVLFAVMSVISFVLVLTIQKIRRSDK